MYRYFTAGKRNLFTCLRVLALVLTLIATTASCGLLGGSGDSDAVAQGGSGGGTTSIKVTIMPTTDVAPFHLAVKEGYFKAEGLEVKSVDVKSSEQSTDKLTAGEVDIAYAAYGPLFLAEDKGAAGQRGGVKLIADASSAGLGSCVVVAMPNSPIRSVKDMAGRKVAVTSASSISAILIMSTLKTNGIDPNSVKWKPLPFPNTAEALQKGDVDAAFLTEPFLTAAQKTVGAVPLFDTATGPTANFPTAGWAATGNFVKNNPDTIAKFQRVMQKATDEAKADRSKVEPLLVEFSKVDQDTAKLATLLTFQSTLDATRIQRVPDLMLEFALIKNKLAVQQMIVKSPSSS